MSFFSIAHQRKSPLFFRYRQVLKLIFYHHATGHTTSRLVRNCVLNDYFSGAMASSLIRYYYFYCDHRITLKVETYRTRSATNITAVGSRWSVCSRARKSSRKGPLNDTMRKHKNRNFYNYKIIMWVLDNNVRSRGRRESEHCAQKRRHVKHFDLCIARKRWHFVLCLDSVSRCRSIILR